MKSGRPTGPATFLGVGWVVAASLASCARPPLQVAHLDARRATDGTPVVVRAPTSEFRVATFNAGLAVGVVQLASERVEPVALALPEIGADLVCVQEVWLEEHWARVIAATSAALPHAVRVAAEIADTSARREAACSAEEVAPIANCAKTSCPGMMSDQLASCAIAHCRGFVKGISSACVNCVVQDPVGTVDAILEPCIGPKGATRTSIPSSQKIVAYGGSYGIGVLTRETIVAQDFIRFETDLNPRAAIYTRVRTAALGEVDTFCTHLTPDVSELAPPPGRTWRDVHAGQVDALAKWIDSKTDASRPVLLLGDLNSGPERSVTLTGRFSEDYARIVAHGFVNAYLQDPQAACTFCYDNPLNGGGDEGTIIDHILFKNFAGPIKIERVLREPIEVRLGQRTVRAAYSDHYGLKATLQRSRD